MINEALSAIINLLKLKKDVKKTDLEIERLEREQKKEKSTIQIASFDEIKKFDPRARENLSKAEEVLRGEIRASPARSQAPLQVKDGSKGFWWVVLGIVAALLLYKCAT